MTNPRSFSSALVRASRSLRRRPGFFIIAVSSLAIALGLATTVIAQIDSLMHPFTPIKDAEQLYTVGIVGQGPKGRPLNADVNEALTHSGLFDAVAPQQYGNGEIEIGPGVLSARWQQVNRDWLDLMGVRTRLGRLFTPSETIESGVAVVSDQFWRHYFGNAPTVEGATFSIDHTTYAVVGVLDPVWDNTGEEGYFFRQPGISGRIMLPARVAIAGQREPSNMYVGHVKAGVTRQNINSVLEALSQRWTMEYGGGRGFHSYAMSLKPDPLSLGTFHRAMIGAAFFILIIGCANVSALMLARSVANRRGQALRLALGAGRIDLLRDVTAETTILAAGGLAGVVIAFVAMGIMTAVTPPELAWLGFARPNWNPRVFAGLFAAVLVSIAVAAIIPAWYVSRIAPAEPLKEGSGTTTGRSSARFKLLVVGELALSMVLLFGASLISKTAHKVATFPFGYETGHLTEFKTGAAVVRKLTPPVPRDSVRRVYRPREILYPELDVLIARLRALPDVRDAAWYAKDAAEHDIVVSQATIVIDSMLLAPRIFNVGTGFLSTLGLAIAEGRDFTETDRMSGAVILDEWAAKRLFPDGSAVGRSVKLGDAHSNAAWLPVIGVTHNAVHELPAYPEMEPPPVIYVSREKTAGFYPSFVVRAARGVTDIAPIGTRTLRDALPPGSYVSAAHWAIGYDQLLAGRRFTAGVFATLSLASLALATAGLFGVLSYAVNERMREFALRVALGAQRWHVLGLVFRDGFVMALGGTAIGALVGMYAGFALYNWLWGVYPVDVFALVIAESVLLVVTFAASAIPALRATRANPSEVMRAI